MKKLLFLLFMLPFCVWGQEPEHNLYGPLPDSVQNKIKAAVIVYLSSHVKNWKNYTAGGWSEIGPIYTSYGDSQEGKELEKRGKPTGEKFKMYFDSLKKLQAMLKDTVSNKNYAQISDSSKKYMALLRPFIDEDKQQRRSFNPAIKYYTLVYSFKRKNIQSKNFINYVFSMSSDCKVINAVRLRDKPWE